MCEKLLIPLLELRDVVQRLPQVENEEDVITMIDKITNWLFSRCCNHIVINTHIHVYVYCIMILYLYCFLYFNLLIMNRDHLSEYSSSLASSANTSTSNGRGTGWCASYTRMLFESLQHNLSSETASSMVVKLVPRLMLAFITLNR